MADTIKDAYQTLLLKYIEHVNDCEGITFIDGAERYGGFSIDEIAKLRSLEQMIFNHNKGVSQ